MTFDNADRFLAIEKDLVTFTKGIKLKGKILPLTIKLIRRNPHQENLKLYSQELDFMQRDTT